MRLCAAVAAAAAWCSLAPRAATAYASIRTPLSAVGHSPADLERSINERVKNRGEGIRTAAGRALHGRKHVGPHDAAGHRDLVHRGDAPLDEASNDQNGWISGMAADFFQSLAPSPAAIDPEATPCLEEQKQRVLQKVVHACAPAFHRMSVTNLHTAVNELAVNRSSNAAWLHDRLTGGLVRALKTEAADVAAIFRVGKRFPWFPFIALELYPLRHLGALAIFSGFAALCLFILLVPLRGFQRATECTSSVRSSCCFPFRRCSGQRRAPVSPGIVAARAVSRSSRSKVLALVLVLLLAVLLVAVPVFSLVRLRRLAPMLTADVDLAICHAYRLPFTLLFGTNYDQDRFLADQASPISGMRLAGRWEGMSRLVAQIDETLSSVDYLDRNIEGASGGWRGVRANRQLARLPVRADGGQNSFERRPEVLVDLPLTELYAFGARPGGAEGPTGPYLVPYDPINRQFYTVAVPAPDAGEGAVAAPGAAAAAGAGLSPSPPTLPFRPPSPPPPSPLARERLERLAAAGPGVASSRPRPAELLPLFPIADFELTRAGPAVAGGPLPGTRPPPGPLLSVPYTPYFAYPPPGFTALPMLPREPAPKKGPPRKGSVPGDAPPGQKGDTDDSDDGDDDAGSDDTAEPERVPLEQRSRKRAEAWGSKLSLVPPILKNERSNGKVSDRHTGRSSERTADLSSERLADRQGQPPTSASDPVVRHPVFAGTAAALDPSSLLYSLFNQSAAGRDVVLRPFEAPVELVTRPVDPATRGRQTRGGGEAVASAIGSAASAVTAGAGVPSSKTSSILTAPGEGAGGAGSTGGVSGGDDESVFEPAAADAAASAAEASLLDAPADETVAGNTFTSSGGTGASSRGGFSNNAFGSTMFGGTAPGSTPSGGTAFGGATLGGWFSTPLLPALGAAESALELFYATPNLTRVSAEEICATDRATSAHRRASHANLSSSSLSALTRDIRVLLLSSLWRAATSFYERADSVTGAVVRPGVHAVSRAVALVEAAAAVVAVGGAVYLLSFACCGRKSGAAGRSGGGGCRRCVPRLVYYASLTLLLSLSFALLFAGFLIYSGVLIAAEPCELVRQLLHRGDYENYPALGAAVDAVTAHGLPLGVHLSPGVEILKNVATHAGSGRVNVTVSTREAIVSRGMPSVESALLPAVRFWDSNLNLLGVALATNFGGGAQAAAGRVATTAARTASNAVDSTARLIADVQTPVADLIEKPFVERFVEPVVAGIGRPVRPVVDFLAQEFGRAARFAAGGGGAGGGGAADGEAGFTGDAGAGASLANKNFYGDAPGGGTFGGDSADEDGAAGETFSDEDEELLPPPHFTPPLDRLAAEKDRVIAQAAEAWRNWDPLAWWRATPAAAAASGEDASGEGGAASGDGAGGFPAPGFSSAGAAEKNGGSGASAADFDDAPGAAAAIAVPLRSRLLTGLRHSRRPRRLSAAAPFSRADARLSDFEAAVLARQWDLDRRAADQDQQAPDLLPELTPAAAPPELAAYLGWAERGFAADSGGEADGGAAEPPEALREAEVLEWVGSVVATMDASLSEVFTNFTSGTKSLAADALSVADSLCYGVMVDAAHGGRVVMQFGLATFLAAIVLCLARNCALHRSTTRALPPSDDDKDARRLRRARSAQGPLPPPEAVLQPLEYPNFAPLQREPRSNWHDGRSNRHGSRSKNAGYPPAATHEERRRRDEQNAEDQSQGAAKEPLWLPAASSLTVLRAADAAADFYHSNVAFRHAESQSREYFQHDEADEDSDSSGHIETVQVGHGSGGGSGDYAELHVCTAHNRRSGVAPPSGSELLLLLDDRRADRPAGMPAAHDLHADLFDRDQPWWSMTIGVDSAVFPTNAGGCSLDALSAPRRRRCRACRSRPKRSWSRVFTPRSAALPGRYRSARRNRSPRRHASDAFSCSPARQAPQDSLELVAHSLDVERVAEQRAYQQAYQRALDTQGLFVYEEAQYAQAGSYPGNCHFRGVQQGRDFASCHQPGHQGTCEMQSSVAVERANMPDLKRDADVHAVLEGPLPAEPVQSAHRSGHLTKRRGLALPIAGFHTARSHRGGRRSYPGRRTRRLNWRQQREPRVHRSNTRSGGTDDDKTRRLNDVILFRSSRSPGGRFTAVTTTTDAAPAAAPLTRCAANPVSPLSSSSDVGRLKFPVPATTSPRLLGATGFRRVRSAAASARLKRSKSAAVH